MIGAEDAALQRDPAHEIVGRQEAGALDAPVDLGPHAELVAEPHLEPPRDAARRHARIEQLVRMAQEQVHRLGGVPLLHAPIDELRAIPRRGRHLEPVPEAEPDVPHGDLRDHVEGPPPGHLEAQLGEGLEGAADPARGSPDALGDRLDLAQLGRQEREDAVRLAEVEAGQDDGVGDVEAAAGHAVTVAPGPTHGAATPWGAAPRAGRSFGRTVGVRGATGLVANAAARRCYDRAVPASPTSLDIVGLLAAVEAEIQRLVADRDPTTSGMYEMVRYHMGLDGSGSSGKRMRPLLGLLAYASITGTYEPALPGAAAVELGHNFSLIHDDIEDGDRERRHRATLWTMHGIPQAINTGDAVFVLSRIALHRLTELGFSDAKVLRLMRLYDETCLALCEGQYIDIWTAEHDVDMTVELYFDMIGRKTAALIAASVEAGALLATDDDEVVGRYRAFGWALGLAFQLNDDLLGIWGLAPSTGKEPSDLAKHKKTLPVIYALQHGAPSDRQRLAAIYARAEPSAVEIAEALRDPGPGRRRRLHAVTGPPLARRGARPARRGRGGRTRRAGAPGADHAERDLGVAPDAATDHSVLLAGARPTGPRRPRPLPDRGRPAGGRPGPWPPDGRRSLRP